MDITSPFVVVPVFVVVFFTCILWATRTDPANQHSDDGHSGHPAH